MTAPSMPDWNALRDTIAGQVVLPGSAEYDVLRKPAMVRFHDLRPQAVVRCVTDVDVAETVLFTRRFGLRMAMSSCWRTAASSSATSSIIQTCSGRCAARVPPTSVSSRRSSSTRSPHRPRRAFTWSGRILPRSR
jgi:hypothetical protein